MKRENKIESIVSNLDKKENQKKVGFKLHKSDNYVIFL